MEVPTYRMILDPEDVGLGMKIMSVVETPAILVNWAKFSNTEIKLSIQNEEQRIVFGPALIPDLQIKRTILSEVFYVSIDRENILQTAIKFQKDGVANRLDTNHDNQLLQGITIFESFVTDENRVLSAKGFEELPIGTWFITAKVNNDEIWNKIKAGELNGFSIDALFKFEKSATLTDKEVLTSIKEILNTL